MIRLAGTEHDPIRYLGSVALQAYQWTYNADRFASGRIVCAYRPDVRHGEIVRVRMPEGFGGEGKGGGSAILVAYCETVEHSWTAMPDGRIRARTTIHYTRGLFSEDVRTMPPPASLGLSPRDLR